MSEVTITINGRHYDISCEVGQEGRITDLAGYIDQQISKIAQTGAAYNDSHLQILALLVIADELFEAKEKSLNLGATETLTETGVSDAQLKKMEKMVRDEISAEYAERLNILQTKLANSNKPLPGKDAQDSNGEKSVLKILNHLNERVNGLAAKVDTL